MEQPHVVSPYFAAAPAHKHEMMESDDGDAHGDEQVLMTASVLEFYKAAARRRRGEGPSSS